MIRFLLVLFLTAGAVLAGPPTGKYTMFARPTFRVGSFELKSDGTYQTATGGKGKYSFGGQGVVWLSGPFKDQNFLGIYTDKDKQTGKPLSYHRIQLQGINPGTLYASQAK